MTNFKTLNNIVNLEWNEYRELPGLNFHSLKDFCENPKKYDEGWYDEHRDETPAMRRGTQFHHLYLQGEEFFHAHNALWVPPTNPKTGEPFGAATKAYKEALDEWTVENSGKRPYSEDDWNDYQAMLAEAERNKTFSGTLRKWDSSGVHSEVMFYGDFNGITDLKGSIDRFDETIGLVDLKTTSSLTKRWFEKDIYDWQYVDQLAFYQIALKDVCGLDEYPDAYIAAIETSGQYRSGAVKLSEPVMAAARQTVFAMIGRYIEYEKNGICPGPFDELIVAERYPKWYLQEVTA